MYSLGPSGAGGAAAGGDGAEPDGAAGELNNRVYSPPPDGAGGGAGAGGALGLALEKVLVIPPGSTAGGDTPGIGEGFGGPEGVPNKRVNAPGSCCAGAGVAGGVAAGGRLRSSPPGLDSGIGDWKNRVNSPELSAAAAGGSALAGGPPGDRNIFVNAPGSEGGAAGAGGGGCGLATFIGGLT